MGQSRDKGGLNGYYSDGDGGGGGGGECGVKVEQEIQEELSMMR